MKANSDEPQGLASVVDSGSVSVAAEQVGLTTSAVSRTPSRLKHRSGTTLLNRTTRYTKLTEEGRYFLDQARQILQQMEALEERLALRWQSPTGHLWINAASPFMLHAVVPHIGEFHRPYPNIRLELNTNDLIIDLLEQRTSVVIRTDTLSDSTLRARPLGASCLYILASPKCLARHSMPMSIERLRGHALLSFTQPEHLDRWPVVRTDDDRLEIQLDVSASSGETLRQLVLNRQGITYLASFMIDRDVQDGRLVPLFAEQMSEYRQPTHAVYYRNSQPMLHIQCFLGFTQQRLST